MGSVFYIKFILIHINSQACNISSYKARIVLIKARRAHKNPTYVISDDKS
jgi:hypothetical protein